ncbi:Cell surface mannoprotein mp65 [Emydomyces testavorans]|uniref:Cell surface mannoprotein mp65 n=1 Tax=Emydomyces testavorans TaxID=2070801 RepID=A0AAF0DKS3_9EURO|nr:Cell surface mannoprotein mp65 [Emydomyces testavorans]
MRGQVIPKNLQDVDRGNILLPTVIKAEASPTNSTSAGTGARFSKAEGNLNELKPGLKAPKDRRAAASSFGGMGICYSPYTAAGTCKPQNEIDSDLARLKKYSTIRSYGVDCNQVSMILSAAKQNGLKLFAGIYDLNNLDGDLQIVIRSAKHSWSDIAAIAIGNELVLKVRNSPDQVVDAIHKARGILRSAGYHGPVVTVDTSGVLIQHPQLCHASDFCAANAHAFFSSSTSAHDAGHFTRKQADMVSAAAGGKMTVIVEAGWPSAGRSNGKAVPTDQNQEIAVRSLRDSFKDRDGHLFLFSAFNDKWKKDFDGSFGAEQFWGIEN